MQPADPADLTAALATVRELTADPQRAMTDDEWRSLNIASRLLARELVRLLDAGELMRKVPCTAIGPHHRDPCQNGRVQAPNSQFWRDCTVCRGAGYTLEPLFAKDKP